MCFPQFFPPSQPVTRSPTGFHRQLQGPPPLAALGAGRGGQTQEALVRELRLAMELEDLEGNAGLFRFYSMIFLENRLTIELSHHFVLSCNKQK